MSDETPTVEVQFIGICPRYTNTQMERGMHCGDECTCGATPPTYEQAEQARAESRAALADFTTQELIDAIRGRPDYVFGVIFLTEDFPGGIVPDDFPRSADDTLCQHGFDIIGDYAPSEECEECGERIPTVVEGGGGLANRHHAKSCSLYDPDAD
jgi:hypothetical protein